MTLLDEARRAEDIGNALPAFRDPNPGSVQDINTAIAEANNLGTALREIERILEEPDVPLDYIEDDLQLTHKGIMLTLKAVWKYIGDIGNGRSDLIDYDYQVTWGKIDDYCRSRGVPNLNTCLGNYRCFVTVLCKTVKKENLDQHEYLDLRHKIKQLDRTIPRPTPAGNERPAQDLITQQQRVTRLPSFERERGAPNSPLSPTDSDGSHRFPNHFFAPRGQSPPMSPPTTASSLSQGASNEGEQTEHWAKTVFSNVTATQLPLSDEQSRYHGPDQPTHDPPSSRYKEALAMTFPPGLGVSLFYRPSRESRAKMVVRVPISHRHSVTMCLPLAVLELVRSGCMLRIYRMSEDQRHLVRWVSLQFSTIEMLVLFANTFIVMKSVSGGAPESPLWRDGNGDESKVFDAVYLDNGSRKTLSIYRDKPSKSIRLQSSIRGGSSHGCPLWTAWITHYVTSPTWVEVFDRKTVLLRDLRLHVFSSRYSPARAANGTYVFNFESSSSMNEFIERLEELRRRILRNR